MYTNRYVYTSTAHAHAGAIGFAWQLSYLPRAPVMPVPVPQAVWRVLVRSRSCAEALDAAHVRLPHGPGSPKRFASTYALPTCINQTTCMPQPHEGSWEIKAKNAML